MWPRGGAVVVAWGCRSGSGSDAEKIFENVCYKCGGGQEVFNRETRKTSNNFGVKFCGLVSGNA